MYDGAGIYTYTSTSQLRYLTLLTDAAAATAAHGDAVDMATTSQRTANTTTAAP